MSTAKFDSYGEFLPVAGSGRREPREAVSTMLGRIGQAGFWLLVVVIVAARIAYFSPAPSFSDHVVSILTHIAQR